MQKVYIYLGTLFLVLVIASFVKADLEINGTDPDKKSSEIVNSISNLTDKVETNAVNLESNAKDNSTKQLELKDSNKNGTDYGSDKEGVSRDRVKNVTDSRTEKEKTALPSVRKESFRGEECDSSSIGCTDDKKTLVACLRVPGNESPELSLLIQNKGKGTLSIKISAPDFVQLEKDQIQIEEQEDKKVKVSVKGVGKDNIIVLTAGNGKCTLDFKDLVMQSTSNKASYASQFTYINLFNRTPSLVFIFLAALLMIATPFMCVKFRASMSIYGSKYQKLDAELPISAGSKTEFGSTDGWDDSWGDSWDDEEAPKTPSMPVTPSLSSKGIASRRLSKDSWKD